MQCYNTFQLQHNLLVSFRDNSAAIFAESCFIMVLDAWPDDLDWGGGGGGGDEVEACTVRVLEIG